MRIKFKASHLIEALGVVAIVDPRPIVAQQSASVYLFHCFLNKDEDNKPWCRVYSRNNEQVARAGFELEEMDEPGQFTFLVQPIKMFLNIPDDVITIQSETFKEGGPAPALLASTSSGVKYTHSAVDPRHVVLCDKEVEEALQGGKLDYAVGIMREALTMAQSFLPEASQKETVDEHFSTVQIFDSSNPAWAQGDGHMFCSDGHRAFYFQTTAFEGKGFTIHARHVNKVTSFLGRCSGEVAFYRNATWTYAVNGTTNKETGKVKDQILGWKHQLKAHTRFASYPPSRDKYVLHIGKDVLVTALDVTTSAIDAKQEKIHLVYTHDDKSIRFSLTESAGKFESFPVPCHKASEPSLEKDLDFYMNLKDFKSLITGVKGNLVELRFSPIAEDAARPRGGAMLRTFDDVTFDQNGKVVMITDTSTTEAGVLYKCRVTRFMTSMA